MVTLRCKMCGGTLNVEENVYVAECEYCGTKQTLPKVTDEKKTALFDRANQSRSMNEFDKAALIYENILSEFPDEAEAYWGLCLCRYGIEYVSDPRTNKRVPTCHRAQFGSILQDKNYLAAIENADFMARDVYRQEAEYIDSVQKNILAISSKEEPFDIFICYKESDEKGERTLDSVIAQDIYDELTEKGYKVFFARITLEDKLGMAYEPYIFAALNSAKIMLVVGTKPEYFEAVWVRNEWSRYLELIEQGEKKSVIPCYRNMSPYDLPREFLALQAQDVSKLGYMQDLVRGIQKIMGDSTKTKKPASVENKTSAPETNGQFRIRSVQSIGTNDMNDYWAKGNLTSVINRNTYSVVSFQMTMQSAFGFDGQIKLDFKVRDEIGNLVHNTTSTIHVRPTDDRLAQTFVLKGTDGTMVQAGIYHATFSVNGGPEFDYTFKVLAGRETSNANYVAPQPQPQGKKKSVILYVVLAVWLGYFGAHNFYAGRKGRGILKIVLFFSLVGGNVSGASILALWILIEVVSAIIKRRVPVKIK